MTELVGPQHRPSDPAPLRLHLVGGKVVGGDATTAEGSVDEEQRASAGRRGSRAPPLRCRMSLGDVTWRKGLRSRLPWPGAGCKGGAGPEEEADAVRRRTSEPALPPPVAQRSATMRMGRQKLDEDAIEESEIGDRWNFFWEFPVCH